MEKRPTKFRKLLYLPKIQYFTLIKTTNWYYKEGCWGTRRFTYNVLQLLTLYLFRPDMKNQPLSVPTRVPGMDWPVQETWANYHINTVSKHTESHRQPTWD